MRLRLMDDGLFGALRIGNARFLFLFVIGIIHRWKRKS